MAKFIDLTGKKFNRLVVIKRMVNNKWGSHQWLCECNCGQKIIVSSSDLKRNHTQSGGCLQKERVTKHGHWSKGQRSRIYRIWQGMVRRCMNSKCEHYNTYGGRGITVCERWRKFIDFLEDMGEPPTKKHQIDRINNNNGYYKENCRWVTPKQQARNRRNNRLIMHNERIQCITAWSEETGISCQVISWRLCHGWSTERTFTTPVKKYQKHRTKR